MKHHRTQTINTLRPRLVKRPGLTWGIFTVSAFALLLSGCQPKENASVDVLATVGNQVVTEAQFRHWWQERRPASDTAETRARLLDQLIERSAMAEAARAAGLDRDPLFLEQMESLLVSRLQETQLQPKLKTVTVSETDVRSDYEQKLAEKFSVPERTHVAVLWFDTRDQQPLVERYFSRLKEARDQAAGLPVAKGFGELALKNTEHRASRFRGGDVGWLEDHPANDAWHQRVLEIAAPLREPGQVSPVVYNEQGLFLVRLIERRESGTKSFESVREGIERRLIADRRRKMEEEFRGTLLERVPVGRFQDRLLALRDLPVREEENSHPMPLSARRSLARQ